MKWDGDLLSGSGALHFDSGALPNVPVTWKARIEGPAGMTSPEELLAGAHAACFAMVLAHKLAKNGTPPESMTVGAACTFSAVGEGFNVTEMDLTVTAKVPGLDLATFQDIAEKSGVRGCPISEALSWDVLIKVDAKLE